MPFIDLKAQFRVIEPQVRSAIDRVLTHGKFIMGPEVEELEERLASFTKVKYVISCSSGTDALLMPLMAWDIRPGDAVFTSTFTFIATAEVISLLGATPVFVDIDPHTFNLDPAKLEEAVLRVKREGRLRARCVIPVDLFGLPADYGAIESLARREGLKILEDAAQSFGARYQNQRTGNLGDAAGMSFFPAKPLGAYGDAGAVFTNSADIAERVRSIRIHGKGTDKYDNVRVGLNARVDTLQAAILLAKLSVFETELVNRQRVATRYTKKIGGLVELQHIPTKTQSAWAQFAVLTEQRDVLKDYLKSQGVPSMIYYPKPLHRQTTFAHLNYSEGDLPVSEWISKRILSLPMHPYLKDDEVDEIADAITSFFARDCSHGMQ